MKNTLKTKLFESFEEKLAQAYPDMAEHNRRNIANLMQNISIEILIENNDGITNSYNEAIKELEAHKKLFRDHVEELQKESKGIIQILRKNGLVSTSVDRKTNKPILVGRTTVITETVAFLNKMNEFTMNFYENVYKIEDNNSFGTQTTLF
jgi:translation elongation factor EF-1beta